VSEDVKRALEAARTLEKHGSPDAAVQAYLDAGAPQEAARVLTTHKRFTDAAMLMLKLTGLEMPIELKLVNKLPPDAKKLANISASCFARAGDVKSAVELWVGLGERARAADLLERSGDPVGAAKLRGSTGKGAGGMGIAPASNAVGGAAVNLQAAQRLEEKGSHESAMQAYVQLKQYAHAARMARKLGRVGEAAGLYAEAGQPFDAGMAYLEAGDTGKAMDNLTRVPRNDPRYRQACMEVIKLSIQLNVASFQSEHLLTQFVASGPEDGRELESF
jgi:tetratricopeptide (TPR) repeat protein